MQQPLTAAEQAELDALSNEFEGADSAPVGLSAQESAELAALEAEFGGSQFDGLAPEQRGELAAQRLGTPEASALDIAGNAVRAGAYVAGDIPAGIDQLASRYLPLPESWKAASDKRVAEYEDAKRSALAKPGGTTGYVGGQIGTAFVPGFGIAKTAVNATKATKALAHARPVAAGVGLTTVKPYETEADRFSEGGFSAALGAGLPVVGAVGSAGARAIGGKIRPSVPRGKPPGNGAGVPPGPPPPGGVAPAGAGAPPGGAPPVPPASGGFDDPFIRKLKSAPQSQKKGELLEKARELRVTPTPGQVASGEPAYLESQMLKKPGSRKVAENAYRESHESFHRALGREIGLEDAPYLSKDVIEAAKGKLSAEYEEILPQIQMKRGGPITSKLVFDTNKLVKPFGDLEAPNIPKSEIRKLANIKAGLDNQLANAGEISGAELKRWKSQIDKIAKDPGLDAAVTKRLKAFKDSLNETFAKALDETNPELAARLRTNDQRWSNAKILQEVQQSAGANVEGFISGPKLLNAVVKKYGNPSKVGNFGALAEMGQMFYQKLPDSGTADRIVANTLLGGGLGAAGVGAFVDFGTTAALLGAGYGTSKVLSHAYYQTPAYQRALGWGRGAGTGGTKIGASGAGRTGRDDKPKNALLH